MFRNSFDPVSLLFLRTAATWKLSMVCMIQWEIRETIATTEGLAWIERLEFSWEVKRISLLDDVLKKLQLSRIAKKIVKVSFCDKKYRWHFHYSLG